MKSKAIFKNWYSYLKPHILEFSGGIVIILFISGLSAFAPMLIRTVIDYGILGKDIHILLSSTLSYLLIYFLYFWLNFRVTVQMEKLGQDILIDIKSDTYKALLKKKMGFFSEYSEGTLISRVESDGESVRQFFTSNTIRLFSDLIILIGMMIIMSVINVTLFFYLMVTIVPILIFVVYLYSTMARPRYLKYRKVIASLSSFIVEYFKGMELVKIFDRRNFIKKFLKKLDADYYKTGFKAEYLNIIFFNFITFVQIVGFAIVLWFGGKMMLKGTTTIGTLVLFITYIRQFFEPIRSLSFQISAIEKAKASSERIFEIQKEEDNIEYQGEISPTYNNLIEFKNIDFSYDKNKKVLKNVSLAIKKGKRIALIGRTGGGKTTIIKLLLKLIAPNNGEIIVDGKKLSNLKTNAWREQIGYISQSIFLFSGTLMDNLKMFDNSIEEEEVFDAAKKVGVYDYIRSLPKEFNTEVLEGGSNFSKGQQQLFNIVRAIVKKPNILIMDEATSTIDAKYERAIVKALRRIAKDTTMIAVAHRISTISDSDKIFIIDDGRIIQSGTHQDLIKESNIYKRYNSILSGEIDEK
jgi:ABC-type multidrug transport system fused ATPase/permease subunit